MLVPVPFCKTNLAVVISRTAMKTVGTVLAAAVWRAHPDRQAFWTGFHRTNLVGLSSPARGTLDSPLIAQPPLLETRLQAECLLLRPAWPRR